MQAFSNKLFTYLLKQIMPKLKLTLNMYMNVRDISFKTNIATT